jgi:signal transduction histidine kinase
LVCSTAVLVGLLAALATLQYRWLGQVSEADAARLRAGALSRAEQFARDFDREATLAFLWLQVPAGAARAQEVPAFADRHARWQRTAAFPGLVRDVWLVEGETLFRFVPAARAFERADWPSALAPLRSRRWPFQIIHEEVPAIVAPVPSLELVRTSLRGEARFRLAGLSVIRLDLDHVRDEVLPALARRHFGGADGDYSLRVESAGDRGRAVYLSDPGSLGSGGSGDASVALLDVRLDLASREDLDLLSASSTNEGAEMRHVGWLRRGVAPRRTDNGRWRLVVTHRAGSVDAVVAAARRRNLAISGGVLALLAASAVLTAVSAQRARGLAHRQIEFVASVSHELRTPVAVICSAGDNLAEGVVSDAETMKQYGRLVRSEGRRLAEMVEQVLDYAGTYAGRRFWRVEDVNLPELLEEILAALRPGLEEAGATVEAAIAPDLPRVGGDRDALRRAVQNLIQNAAKYGGEARFVGLRARAVEADGRPQACITVEDHGLGIPPVEVAQIFEPFFRGEEALRRQIRGTGLGLSLVKRIVEAHGGTVRVASRPGQGSAFTITLPAVLLPRSP